MDVVNIKNKKYVRYKFRKKTVPTFMSILKISVMKSLKYIRKTEKIG